MVTDYPMFILGISADYSDTMGVFAGKMSRNCIAWPLCLGSQPIGDSLWICETLKWRALSHVSCLAFDDAVQMTGQWKMLCPLVECDEARCVNWWVCDWQGMIPKGTHPRRAGSCVVSCNNKPLKNCHTKRDSIFESIPLNTVYLFIQQLIHSFWFI